MSRKRLAAVERDADVVGLDVYRARRSQARRHHDVRHLPATLPVTMALAPFAFALCWMIWWLAPLAAASSSAHDHRDDDRPST
jgi:hypothetical protein